MSDDEGVIPIGQFMPGDVIRAEITLRNLMNIHAVEAVFQNVDDPDWLIALTDDSDDVIDRIGPVQTPTTVTLSAFVPRNTPPGTYRLSRILVESFEGRLMRIHRDQAGNLGRYAIEILPEPPEAPAVVEFTI